MAIPDYETIMLPLLQYAGDGQVHSFREAIQVLAEYFQLTDEEQDKLVPSGSKTVFQNRASWASTYLKKAGLLEAPRRGYFRITQRGLVVLKDAPNRIDRDFLLQFPEFLEFQSPSRVDDNHTVETVTDTSIDSPEEAIISIYRRIRQKLEADLLELVQQLSPAQFERIVLDLLVKMGYGTGEAVGRTGDGGVDGVITEDKLGLEKVYVQAKRWDGTVGRPDIQRFAGALQGERARKGVFITTSTFSREAEHYAASIDIRIVLIDGQRLAELMVDYNVGVSIVKTYEIKQIDSDYFDGSI
jgi:restriction system protein